MQQLLTDMHDLAAAVVNFR